MRRRYWMAPALWLLVFLFADSTSWAQQAFTPAASPPAQAVAQSPPAYQPTAYQPPAAQTPIIGAQPLASAGPLGQTSILGPANAAAPAMTAGPISDPETVSRGDFESLRKRLEQTEAEVRQLRSLQPANGAIQAAYNDGRVAQYAAPTAPGQVPTPAVDDANGGLFGAIRDRLNNIEQTLKKAQSYPSVQVHGFFQEDSAFFSQDNRSKLTDGNIQNGTGFRRARLMAQGSVAEHTNYWVEMDFASSGHPSFQDVWGEQTNLPFVGAVRVGQYRQPITMTSWTNIKHLEFMERSLAFQAFDPFRRVGAMGYGLSDNERTQWAYGIYGTGATFLNGQGTTNGSNIYNDFGDNRFGTQLGDVGGASFALRASHLLYYDPAAEGRYLLHVGGGVNYSRIGGNSAYGGQTFQARAIPEVFVGDPAAVPTAVPGGGVVQGGTPFVVDSGRFLATSSELYHVELAGSYGPAHFQAEYMLVPVQQMTGPTVLFSGGYVQAGYFLTGENTGYNKAMGVMDYNCKPFTDFFGLGRHSRMCGWGAWEVASRLSYLNLDATNVNAANYRSLATNGTGTTTTAAGAMPGTAGNDTSLTLSLNWWWNQYTRVNFNYIHNMLQSNINGFSAMDIAAARFQVEF
jgi:phosphate-selective porin OprO/OprP